MNLQPLKHHKSLGPNDPTFLMDSDEIMMRELSWLFNKVQ